MRYLPFLLSALATILLIWLLNTAWSLKSGTLPPLGKFLSPQHGFWQNAERNDADLNENLVITGLQGKSSVYMDDRLVPHIFAENDHDAYFIEGFLHAKYRLWQMEFQTRAAAGRLCEILGEKVGGQSLLDRADRYFRRQGMVYAAEKSLALMEKDSFTISSLRAYTDGVNAYINTLTESELPIEYKLLNYKPEPWTTLKSALLAKYLAFDLTGRENDFEYMNARSVFSASDFEKIYPTNHDSIDPIVPEGTVPDTARLVPHQPVGLDSFYNAAIDTNHIVATKPHPNNGSNNWAVSGAKTASGKPILCNDPHLGLNLPSIWYEIQIHTPGSNAYGVSLPGAPFVIIGFNDSCAFGFTNATRDVKDYYEINFRDDDMKEYWFNGEWQKTTFRYEHIALKGAPDYIDTVAYTVMGPVIFDKHYNGGRTSNGKYYALRWKAHDPSNDVKTFGLLNRAHNYADYLDAIRNLHTPGQNCIFAAKNGDIALWDQGEFPAKWRRQGDFIMPGKDSSFFWQGMIPQEENPHLYNPPRNFVSSANQYPIDPSAYAYYLGGQYPQYRGILINRYLAQMNGITPQDMMHLQNNNYNLLAELARPKILQSVDAYSLNPDEKKYFDLLKNWNLLNNADEKGATVFTVFWGELEHEIWDDEFGQTKLPMQWPQRSTTLEGILKDSSFKFADNINTPEKENVAQDILSAFKKAAVKIAAAEAKGNLEWGKYKDTHITHLLRLDAFSRKDLDVGGGDDIINATTPTHGPSWRMVVQLTTPTEAFVVYPGGQSGNPGSKHYDDFVTDWASGNYYSAFVMTSEDGGNNHVAGKMNFSPR